MDLSQAVYSRDLKIAAMRALASGSATGEIARKYQLSLKLLEQSPGEWRAKGELAFPGIGRRGADLPALDDAAASPSWSASRPADDGERFPKKSLTAFQGSLHASRRQWCG